MPKKGFVDKSLIGLKDRLSNLGDREVEEASVNVSAVEHESTSRQDEITHKPTDNATLDKEFSRALSERKKEFLRIRSDVLKKIKNSSINLPGEIKKCENWLSGAKTTKAKLDNLVETISSINEKTWDKSDFSQELAEAMKTVENARLELFTQQMKASCLEEEDTPGLEKHNSIIPELTSLSAWQLLRMGLSFFFPLIIGLLLTGIIISIAMLIAMGTV